jgi:hypothetical protein
LKQDVIKILAAQIETELGFFEMDGEFFFWDALEFLKPVLGVAPKALDAVDVVAVAA